jgi:hypothetical protein
MQTRLGHPTSDDDLYLGLEDDVDPYRPVMPGDVFRVKIRAVEVDHELAMLVAHPCNMRKGPHLRRSLPMIPVVPYRRVPFDEWPNGHFRVFPLQPHANFGRPRQKSLFAHFLALGAGFEPRKAPLAKRPASLGRISALPRKLRAGLRRGVQGRAPHGEYRGRPIFVRGRMKFVGGYDGECRPSVPTDNEASGASSATGKSLVCKCLSDHSREPSASGAAATSTRRRGRGSRAADKSHWLLAPLKSSGLQVEERATAPRGLVGSSQRPRLLASVQGPPRAGLGVR